MNKLTQSFETASIYRLDLPNSDAMQLLLDTPTLQRLNQRALAGQTGLYNIFVAEAKQQVESFLSRHYEDAAVGTDTIQQLFGPVSSALEFKASAATGQKLQASLSDLFSNLPLAPEMQAKGCSWNNLPLQRFDKGLIFGQA